MRKDKAKIVFLGDTLINEEPLGVQRYALEIIKEIDKLSVPWPIEVLVPNVEQCNLALENIKVVKYGKYNRTGFVWRQIDYPNYIRRQNALSVDLTLGLCILGSDLVCLHDCIYENYPKDFVGLKRQLKRYSYLFRARRNVKRSRLLLTVSNTSKNELVSYYRIPESKVVVINDAWQHMTNVEEDDTILDELNLSGKAFYFSLGSQLPHKNFKWIIQAAECNPDKLFVVTGSKKITSCSEDYNDRSNIFYSGFLTDGQVKSLMKNSKLFVFPSLYEGFGIPPLEALASGTSIAVSNCSCLPEIYENSAVYFDPLEYEIDMDSIVADAEKVSVNERERILAKYSWEKSAKALIEAIASIM